MPAGSTPFFLRSRGSSFVAVDVSSPIPAYVAVLHVAVFDCVARFEDRFRE
jgi:hypothetical protein